MSPRNQPHIFISYAPENNELASDIKLELARLDFDAWIDQSSRKDTHVFPAPIANAIIHCKIVVVLWTDEATESIWVEQEWRCANELEKPVCIIKISDVPVHEHLHTDHVLPFDGLRTTALELRTILHKLTNAPIADIEKMAHKQNWARLRAMPVENLSGTDLVAVLKKFDFFEPKYNPRGKGMRLDLLVHDHQKLVDEYTTGLTWQVSGSSQPLDFVTAKGYIKDLNRERYCGYKDWRMPTFEEVFSLVCYAKNYKEMHVHPVFDTRQKLIWTCDRERDGQHIALHTETGSIELIAASRPTFVRAVRTQEAI